MNTSEFFNEVKSSDICPDDFDDVYKDFTYYQQRAMETLIEFHRVCEKNNIRYQLAFGSLLGAIRDNGQIPWDYDVDVIIPYSEKTRLIDALNQDLSDEYYYCSPLTDKKYNHFYMRVSPKGFRSDRLHVDVFYVIGVPAEESNRDVFDLKMKKYLHLRNVKLVRLDGYANNAFLTKIHSLFRKAKIAFIPLTKINRELDDICTRYNPEDTGFAMPVLIAYKHLYWKTKNLWDTEIIHNDYGDFRITKNSDEVLKLIYKDYHRIFPLENRLNEMYRSYNLIKYNKKVSDNHTFRYYIES